MRFYSGPPMHFLSGVDTWQRSFIGRASSAPSARRMERDDEPNRHRGFLPCPKLHNSLS
jgi:hypothetical protein